MEHQQGRLLVTGDTHGDQAALAMIMKQVKNGDILFVAGDFGYVFMNDRNEWCFLNDVELFLEKKDIYLVFVDGNHENHKALNSFPVEEWCGARVHKVRKRIIHVLRGEILEIHQRKIFCFGGAFSIDRRWRELDKSYWEEEIPVDEEYRNGNKNLEAYEYKVDYVLTHTCPLNLVPCLGSVHKAEEELPLQNYLQWISDQTEPFRKMFYFGHWHEDMELGKKCRAIYTDVVDMETGEKIW